MSKRVVTHDVSNVLEAPRFVGCLRGTFKLVLWSAEVLVPVVLAGGLALRILFFGTGTVQHTMLDEQAL